MSVSLRAIIESDLENIMRWRMSEDVTKYMNTNPKLTLEGQKKWLAGVNSNKDVRYWLIEIDGKPAGVVNITGLNNVDGIISTGTYVGEKALRSLMNALSLTMSMFDYIFLNLKKQSIHIEVFSLNTGVIRLNKMCGYDILEEKKNHILKEGIYYDVTFMGITADKWLRIRDNKRYQHITIPDI